jgi:hypothetical protein
MMTLTNSGMAVIKDKAISLKEELVKEKNRIGALVSEIDNFLSYVERSPQETPVPQLNPESKIEGPISIIGAAIEIISTDGPIRTPALLDRLTKSGHQVQGKNPIQTLYSTLHKESKRNTPRVERKKGLWCLIQQN